MIKKVVLLTEQSQVDFLNMLWLENKLQPERLPLCSAGFIGCDGYDFPLVAYWNCDSLGSYGWDKFENAKRHAQFITFDKFVELDEIKAMNLDKIETQEEKEVFEGMANSSEIPNGSEWKNGDECIYQGKLYEFQCVASWDGEACIISGKELGAEPLLDVWTDELSKPETPEQKAERERIENGKAIYDLMSSIEMNHDIAGTPNTWAELRDEWQSVYIQLAESVGYRKQNG